MKLKLLLSFAAFLIIVTASIPVYSYPKFAAYTGDKCMDCHVNPTGGGMRREWGVKYSKLFLFFKNFEKANKTTDIDPQLSKGISAGADMRLLFMDNQTGEGNPNMNSFFQMQGDVYVNGQVNKYINLYVDLGLYIPNTSVSAPFEQKPPLPTKYEIFGMVSNLPAGLYFKVGRFIPNFGIKIPEHRAYNRIYNGFYT